MDIIAALFVENMDFRQVPGPSTRIDLGGVMFSVPAPGPFPVSMSPHLIVLLRCPKGDSGFHALNTRYVDEAGTELVTNKQPVQIEPGKFGYRLVKADLQWDSPSTIEARVRVDEGPETIVPLTMLPPVG